MKYINAYISANVVTNSCFTEEHWNVSFKLEELEEDFLENHSRGWKEKMAVFSGTQDECGRVLEYCKKSFPKEGAGVEAPTGFSIFLELLEKFRPNEYRWAQEIHAG